MPPEVEPNLDRRRKENRDPMTAQVAEFEVNDARDVREWLESFGAGQEIVIDVTRKAPRVWRGITIDGHLGKFTEFIDDDFIKENYGGGTYQLIVRRRDHKGNIKYAGSRTVKIGGLAPKIEDTGASSEMPSEGGGNGLTAQAMNYMSKIAEAERAEARAARAQQAHSGGVDPVLAQMFTSQIDALRNQQTDLQRLIAAKDEKLMDVVTRRPEGNSFQDRMLDKMIDGESSRIDAIRTQHDSELRTIRENARQDLERAREQFRDETRINEKRHEREIETMRDAQRTAAEAQKTSFETRIDGLKSEIARLEREVTASKTEISELRARKDKSIVDQVDEITKMRDALKGITGDDDDDRPWYERMISAVAENPQAIGQMIGGVKQNVSLPPAPMPVTVQAQPRRKQRRRPMPGGVMDQALGAGPPSATTPAGSLPPGPKVDPAELAAAIGLMESSSENNTDPAAFAQSARMVVPSSILEHVERVGIDAFLASINLRPDSPLRTQGGRNWVRKVWSFLRTGSIE